jgi:hypothetical protein
MRCVLSSGRHKRHAKRETAALLERAVVAETL